ncbi:hypothetical protein LTR37_018022 [Vermiconidia calcicola]|uniref:Uncharacterized protein n=1 Tax=Vermiconidia calcicola TaxID=1690605 RepID=A0ACC3MJZ3_9PEZI|nr:hypothetical protein LTR37_018022 [Vermiconidia calcicola]
MQNGLGIEDPYNKRFPQATIISSTTRTSAIQNKPGHIKHNFLTRTTIGPFTPNADETVSDIATQRTQEFAALLHAAGIPDVDILDHAGMQFARWHKTAINAAMNPTAVLARGPTNQAMVLDEELEIHLKAVMTEILDVACKILGQPLPEWLPRIADVIQGVQEDISGSHPSMWVDWEAGRKVELEAILGNPLRQAREHGLNLPRTQTIYALLKKAQEMRENQHKIETKLQN